MRPLVVESLSVRGFRNLASVDVEFSPRLNVLFGDNGHGKTNVIEAIYLVAASRSFRTSRLGDMVMLGAQTASIRAQVREQDDRREQSVGVKQGVRVVRIGGKRPATLAAYATYTPTVVFHPGAIALSAGGGLERRRLLDRISLYQAPESFEHAQSYAKAMRARQRVLETRGEESRDLDGWEELVARHGVAVSAARETAAAGLIPAAERTFSHLGPAGLALRARYVRSAPEDMNLFLSELRRRRRQDRARRAASMGPHRDDLVFELGGKSVRGMASQGQHRAVVLAVQLAEIEVVSDARSVRPIVLLDDVSSELDRARTGALFAFLQHGESQVVLTTTRPELIDAGLSAVREQRYFRVVDGQVARS
jgi:DNA replication and repair protein RecF